MSTDVTLLRNRLMHKGMICPYHRDKY